MEASCESLSEIKPKNRLAICTTIISVICATIRILVFIWENENRDAGTFSMDIFTNGY